MMIDTPDHAEDTLAALLVEALDTAVADPIRLALMTRLCLMSADDNRTDNLDRMKRDGSPPVYRS